MVKLFANSGDPDLDLYCSPITFLGVSKLHLLSIIFEKKYKSMQLPRNSHNHEVPPEDTGQ